MHSRPGRWLVWRALALLLLLLTVGALEALADGTVYRYLDETGTPTFTDRWESIPERYRARAEVVAPAVEEAPSRPLGHQNLPSSAASTLRSWVVAPVTGWLGRLEMPRVGRLPLGVGLLTVVLVGGVAAMIRFTSSPALKTFLRVVLVMLLGSGVYLVYLTNVSERLSVLVEPPASPAGAAGGEASMTGPLDVFDKAVDAAGRTAQGAEQAADRRRRVLDRMEEGTRPVF